MEWGLTVHHDSEIFHVRKEHTHVLVNVGRKITRVRIHVYLSRVISGLEIHIEQHPSKLHEEGTLSRYRFISLRIVRITPIEASTQIDEARPTTIVVLCETCKIFFFQKATVLIQVLHYR